MPEDLTPQQELFCRYYTQNSELFGNGTLSYAEAYDYKLDELPNDDAEYEIDAGGNNRLVKESSLTRAKNVCAVEASRLLRNPKIDNRILALFNEMLKDDVVDSHLSKLIVQNKDNTAKIAAIREYNKLKQRIIDKIDHTTKGEALPSASDIDLDAIAQGVADKLKEEKLK